MKKGKNKKQIYQSMKEFEKEYFPESFEKRMSEKPTDAQALGVILAKESLEKIKGRLTK